MKLLIAGRERDVVQRREQALVMIFDVDGLLEDQAVALKQTVESTRHMVAVNVQRRLVREIPGRHLGREREPIDSLVAEVWSAFAVVVQLCEADVERVVVQARQGAHLRTRLACRAATGREPWFDLLGRGRCHCRCLGLTGQPCASSVRQITTYGDNASSIPVFEPSYDQPMSKHAISGETCRRVQHLVSILIAQIGSTLDYEAV